MFVAAFAPDEGENLCDVENGSKDSVLNSALVQYHYPAGPGEETSIEFAINPAMLQEAFAADLPVETTALMAATQRPVAAAAFSDTSGPPGLAEIAVVGRWSPLATRPPAPTSSDRRPSGRARISSRSAART